MGTDIDKLEDLDGHRLQNAIKADIVARRLEILDELGVSYEPYLRNQVLIDGKFVLGLASVKWRILGKNKWYYSKGVEDFVERFVNRG